jgi:PAS domain S-box-containing protein
MRYNIGFKRIDLFSKIASVVLLTFAIAVVVSTAVSIKQQGKIIKTELIAKNTAISKHLSSSIKSAFWSLNWLFVENQMQDTTKSNDTLFLKLIKPDGEVYLYSGSKDCDKDIIIPDEKEITTQVIKDSVCSSTGETIKLIITPIEVGDHKWTLIMGLSLKTVEEAKRTIIKENIIFASVIFLLGVIASFLLTRGITRPIKQLVEGTAQIGKGNLDYKIKITSHDEIGDLADSFNKMADDLKTTMASRDQLAKEVSERKHAEEALKESEERFRSIVENSHEGILIVDNNYKLIYGNDKFGEILGYPLEEIIGRDFRNFLDEESKEFVADNYRKRQKGKNLPSVYEFNIVRKHGEKRRMEISVTVINDSRGMPQTIAQILDITDKKELESQLKRSQKMETIGILAGGVAHDLNNILSGIVSYPELILTDLPEDSPLIRPISTIKKSGERAATIVQDLLTLARRGLTNTEILNFNTIISNQLKSPEFEKLRSLHPNVQIETNFERDLLNVKGSAAHLSKAIMNLLTNAAEAMPSGGNISISTENIYIDSGIMKHEYIKEDEYVAIEITDEGIGISTEDIDRIFEPFYTKKVTGRSGTGLGMAVVWGTVKDHSGYVDVKSSVGKGSTFTLYFPATREHLPADKTLFNIQDYMGNSEFILVVDDIEEQREIASLALRKLGYHVLTLSSGEEAVEYIKDNSVDLLLLDMIMDPGIDGLDTYKKILDIYPGQKAIFVSRFSENERVREARQLGAKLYIKKPYTLEKIGVAVREELRGRMNVKKQQQKEGGENGSRGEG